MLLGNHSRPDAQVQIPVAEQPRSCCALSGLLRQLRRTRLQPHSPPLRIRPGWRTEPHPRQTARRNPVRIRSQRPAAGAQHRSRGRWRRVPLRRCGQPPQLQHQPLRPRQ
ncbi:hypothetical protein CCL23_25740, partial [Pseudomonas syringae]